MTTVVTGLRIRRRTEPWAGNGFSTVTRWTSGRAREGRRPLLNIGG